MGILEGGSLEFSIELLHLLLQLRHLRIIPNLPLMLLSPLPSHVPLPLRLPLQLLKLVKDGVED
jgi:hypothetical protein